MRKFVPDFLLTMIKNLFFESIAYVLSFKMFFMCDGIYLDNLDSEETQFLFDYYSTYGFSNAPGHEPSNRSTLFYSNFIQVCSFHFLM